MERLPRRECGGGELKTSSARGRGEMGMHFNGRSSHSGSQSITDRHQHHRLGPLPRVKLCVCMLGIPSFWEERNGSEEKQNVWLTTFGSSLFSCRKVRVTEIDICPSSRPNYVRQGVQRVYVYRMT